MQYNAMQSIVEDMRVRGVEWSVLCVVFDSTIELNYIERINCLCFEKRKKANTTQNTITHSTTRTRIIKF